jgi:acyl dehydratase
MTSPAEEQFGVLTEAAFTRSRLRNGIPQPQPNPPHNYEVTWDGSRHFAYGYGDDNPLFCDPDYGKKTRWGTLLAPPTFMYTMGDDLAPKPDAVTKAILKGDPFAGLGSYQAVMEFEWWRPLALGDRLNCMNAQIGVKDKPSSFGGRTAHVTECRVFANQKSDVVSLYRGTWINAERRASKERKKETDLPEPYTNEQLEQIDACYAAESRRGADIRYWEDVAIGEELPLQVKGPLTTTDLVVWHLGWGMQLTPPGAFKIAARVRAKAPGLYPPNALNIPDTVQRLHWDPTRAQELGLPTSYDYGGMRETWLAHALSDWVGDDGWLWKLSVQHRRFNFTGDTTWIKGKVTGKQQVSGRNEVELELHCENQRGVITSPATATVLLPGRANGPVVLPDPPDTTLEGVLSKERERLAATEPDANA